MNTINFTTAFQTLTGNTPFPWQQALYDRFVADRVDNIPASCNLPTGLGKTSVVAVWLIALANQLNKMPRRLVYVVNRRTVVDQTTEEIVKYRRRIKDLDEKHPLRSAFGTLAISTLRGQFADNREWSADPSRPAVICGTVDMIGSRLLFSGYGIGFKSRPLHAGYLGQDVLLVHDEAHLEPAFQKLIEAIRDEQKKEPAQLGKELRLKVMELTATPRGSAKPFELTDKEKSPEELPAKLTEPIHYVWQRLQSKKGIAFRKPEGDKEKVADRIGKLAKQYSESHPDSAVLVFVNSLEDHATVCKALTGEQVQVLTGPLRGLERDRMADPRKETGCRIFARFLKPPKPDDEKEQWKITPTPGTVYLVCTSAGEVGIDISADHMVCDLTAFDRMAQRFGRVNRFGTGDANIEIVFEVTPDKKKENDANEQARWKTLELLNELPAIGDRRSASPLALMHLRQREDLKSKFESAYTPQPIILPVSDILFDAWALTTIREKLPGRPPVEPYLHGISEWEPPQTTVAWRDEVSELHREFKDDRERKQFQKYAAELLDDYPLKAHETLADRSDRVFNTLKKLAAALETPVWIVDNQDVVTVTTLGEVLKDDKDGLNHKTLLLSPDAGGLLLDGKGGSTGLFEGSAKYEPAFRNLYDVADKWCDKDGKPLRARIWDGDEAPAGMRFIRTIDTKPGADEDVEESVGKRFWHWYEVANEGGKSSAKPVLWCVHVGDVIREAGAIVANLPLDQQLKDAIIFAARFHDHGKRRKQFQAVLGNFNPAVVLAKSGKKGGRIPELYRHEYGSLVDVQREPEFIALPDTLKDLVLHLIAVHHGRGRPHFPVHEAFDPDQRNTDAVAAEVPRRFARLQSKYGRWGLAYLESLLRAADWAASAKPSEFFEG